MAATARGFWQNSRLRGDLLPPAGMGLAAAFAWELVRVYQLTLSPILGRQCRFHPTCSNYAMDALRKYGFWRGCAKAVIRIAKCHPFHPGGYDPA